MRKGFLRLLTVIGIVGVLVLGLIWYVRPVEELDLQHAVYKPAQELAEMIRERRVSMELSEAEVDALLKAELAARPIGSEHVRLTGARFELIEGGLVAHLNLRAIDRVDIGAEVTYALHWREPDIVAELQDARVKALPLPSGLIALPTFSLNLSDMLPPLVGIKSVDFKEGVIVIRFQLNMMP